MGSRRLALILVLGAFVAAGIYWAPWETTPEPEPETSSEQEEDVKHDFSDFQLVETVEDDEVWYLSAPYSRQTGDTLALDRPHLVLEKKGDTMAVITSDEGNYRMDRGTMLLTGNVVIRRLKNNQVLKTEVLNWDRTEGTIMTDEPVFIESPRGQLRAVGMWADLAEERMRFQSNVQFLSDS